MEEFESLTDEEIGALDERFDEMERRINQLEMEGRDGYTALKNQNRLVHFLGELSRRIEDKFGIELPGLPSLEEPETN